MFVRREGFKAGSSTSLMWASIYRLYVKMNRGVKT